MKKHVPNLLTSFNLFSGCIATVMAFNGQYEWVVFWVIIAALFDFSDGFAARLLKAYSPMGKELDSLADMVSFGLAPSMAVFSMLSQKSYVVSLNPTVMEYLPYIAFLLAIFSGLRLAKFNVDERQSESFIGLNTPANGLFWVSFVCGIMSEKSLGLLTHDPVIFTRGLMYTIIIGIVVFSILMTSEIAMFSLKIKSLKFKGNEQRYFLAIFIIGMIVAVGILGIAAGILMYVALSIMEGRNKYPKHS